jgi:hypothetical protein
MTTAAVTKSEADDDPALVAQMERWLDLAAHLGIDAEAMAYVARRLVARETERDSLLPSRRREELDAMIAEDVETLCLVFVRLRRVVEVVERMPTS